MYQLTCGCIGYSMKLVIFALAAVTSAFGLPRYSSKQSKNFDTLPYRFSWTVQDQHSYNDYSHHARSDGKAVTGSYRVALPDGRIQIVTYKADEYGYVAKVTYEGEVKSDENQVSDSRKSGHTEPAYQEAEKTKYAVTSEPVYPSDEPIYPTARKVQSKKSKGNFFKPYYQQESYNGRIYDDVQPLYHTGAHDRYDEARDVDYAIAAPADSAYGESVFPDRSSLYLKTLKSKVKPSYSKTINKAKYGKTKVKSIYAAQLKEKKPIYVEPAYDQVYYEPVLRPTYEESSYFNKHSISTDAFKYPAVLKLSSRHSKPVDSLYDVEPYYRETSSKKVYPFISKVKSTSMAKSESADRAFMATDRQFDHVKPTYSSKPKKSMAKAKKFTFDEAAHYERSEPSTDFTAPIFRAKKPRPAKPPHFSAAIDQVDVPTNPHFIDAVV